MVGDARHLKRTVYFYMLKFRCLAPVYRNVSLYACKKQKKASKHPSPGPREPKYTGGSGSLNNF